MNEGPRKSSGCAACDSSRIREKKTAGGFGGKKECRFLHVEKAKQSRKSSNESREGRVGGGKKRGGEVGAMIKKSDHCATLIRRFVCLSASKEKDSLLEEEGERAEPRLEMGGANSVLAGKASPPVREGGRAFPLTERGEGV